MFITLQQERDSKIKTLEEEITDTQSKSRVLEQELDDLKKKSKELYVSIMKKEVVSSSKKNPKLQEESKFTHVASLN